MKNTMYTCPMHPKIMQDKPGLCPDCGMQLIKIQDSRYTKSDKHAGPASAKASSGKHSANIFKVKFWVSLILSIPIVAYSDIVQKFLHYQAPQFPGSSYLQLVLASVVFFYGGRVFITSAYRELKAKLPGMMTLIALAISVAYIYSVTETFLGKTDTLYWELATLITIMLLGHWLEMRAVTGAQGALKELSKLLPDEAEVIHGEHIQKIPLAELKKGDLVLVRPGSRIPADGMVKDGQSDVNESIVTGESRPVAKKEGDMVIAGTTNGDGSLKINITKIGDETFLAGVMRLVAEAQSSKSRLQILSDRAAFYLTLVAIIVGGITLAVWLVLADTAFAINRMVAVLVITCPHALGLAIPLVASISTTKAARNGFLVKQRLALEAARTVNTVLFDKTGTLTEGKFIVSKADSNEALQLAASVDAYSEHPVAKAIVEEAKKRGLNLSSVSNFKRLPGIGSEATIDNKKVFVGHRGGADTIVEVDGKEIGRITIEDAIRPESKEAIQKLKELKIETVMITGDSEDVAKQVASELGINKYFARVLPEDKVKKVKQLQSEGNIVAMVGDGINDAPSLTQADLGVAIGAGTNVAIESAGIILVKNDPRDIVKIIRLSKLTYTKMIQNLFWATGYNVIAIPLAAGVLASKGILLQPAVAAILMSLSTVIVAANAVLLKRRSL